MFRPPVFRLPPLTLPRRSTRQQLLPRRRFVPDYLLIETAFTAAQWLIVGPLTALAFEGAPRSSPAIS
jgi:hypothetical protein